MGPLEASYSLAATSVKLNAHKINSFELPLYEQLINTRFKRWLVWMDEDCVMGGWMEIV